MEKPIDLLTKSQYLRAFDWAGEHLLHIGRLIDDIQMGYPPAQEDYNQPNLWKPEHWFWFLKNLS